MPKISQKKKDKITEQILHHLFSISPEAHFTSKIAEEIARETIKETKPKVRKLSKKLLLVAATEAIDEPQVIETTKPKKKSKKVTKPKKNDVVVPNKENIIVMLESDEEDI